MDPTRRRPALRRIAVLVLGLAVALTLPLGPGTGTPASAAPGETEPVGPFESWMYNNDGEQIIGPAVSGPYEVGLNAYAQDHTRGRLYATPAGVHAVGPGMLRGFDRSGGHGLLGYPVAEEETTGDGVRHQDFELGVMVVSAAGSYPVRYPLYRAYRSRGGVDTLGAPTGPERVAGEHRVQEFENGTVTVAREVGQDSLGLRRGNLYYLKNEISPGEAHSVIAYGRPDDTVLVGDWDGDGTDTLAVRRGNLYHVKNSISSGVADTVIAYGRPDDTVLVGDWDGDAADTLAVRRGNLYHVKNSISSGVADTVIAYGRPDDTVLVGDWDGDAADTLAVRRGNLYHVKNSISSGVADTVIAYGRVDDVIQAGDWDGDGRDTFAVRRGNVYHVKNSLSGGAADLVSPYGRTGDVVLVGDWDGRSRAYSRISTTPLTIRPSPGAAALSRVAPGWANNSVNAVSFRKSSLASAETPDGRLVQYTAFYDPGGAVVLAARDRDGGGGWGYRWTQYTGRVTDAHNAISIAVDGDGYLHVAWDHHGTALSYARSVAPWSLELGPRRTMIGTLEDAVTYPEFFRLPDGDLFFLYRNGSAGDGDVVLNRYSTERGRWERVHDNLIDGEGVRSAYWQAAVDSRGRLHLSWTWRESGDVSTNHDIAYARSTDSSGRLWERSTGERYAQLPIREYTDRAARVRDAELAVQIPQRSDLMNQTSMAVDADDAPVIASYWTSGGVTQYRVVHRDGEGWVAADTGIRHTRFDLSGGGTKAVPIARPQILVTGAGATRTVHLLLRDAERGSLASLATRRGDGPWELTDLTLDPLGEWEPTYDLDLWRLRGRLDVFVQNVTQVDGEGLEEYAPQYVHVLDVAPGLVTPLAAGPARDLREQPPGSAPATGPPAPRPTGDA